MVDGKFVNIDLYELGLKIDDPIFLESLFDIHYGHIGCDVKLLERRLNAIIDDPARFTLFGGDQIDAINIYDRRFNPDMVDPTLYDLNNQTGELLEILQPLYTQHLKQKKGNFNPDKKQNNSTNELIWWYLHGNHEYKIKELTRAYLERHYCKPYNVDFLGAKAICGLRVKYKKKVLSEWSIASMHGSGGGQPENMFRDMKKNQNADVYICGHIHQKRYQPETVLDFDWTSGRPYFRDIHLVNGGTFQNALTLGHDGYMDRKNGFTPTNAGTVTLEFDAFEGKITGHLGGNL